MKNITLFLIKSFWLSKGKLLLCLVSALISAVGISSVIYSYEMTERDFRENFAKTNPVDIVLHVEGVTNDLLNALKQNPKVAALERRETLSGKIKNNSGNWMFLTLYGVEDIEKPRISTFDIQEKKAAGLGNWLFVEKSCAAFVNGIGEKLEVQLAGHQAVIFQNTGTVHDAGLPPGTMEQAVYGYTALKNLESFVHVNEQRLLVKVKPQSLTKDRLRSIGKELSKVVSTNGGTVKALIIPPPGEHPHQNIVDGISFLLKIFGFIISVLGIILLSLILITWLHPQISNIGIIKTLGGSTRAILWSYFTVLFLLLGIGLLIGMPLGYKVGQLYSGMIAKIQNFTPVTAMLPLKTHLLALSVSFFLPFLIAVIPLIRASRTTIQNALSQVFYMPNRTFFQWTQVLLPGVSFKYGINNLFRSSGRTVLISLLLIMGFGLFITGANLKYSIKEDFDNLSKNSYYNVNVFLKDTLQGDLAFVEKLPFVEDVSYISRTGGSFRLQGQAFPENSGLKLLPPDYVLPNSLLVSGKVDKRCRNCVYISMKYQADFKNTALGDTLLFNANGEEKAYVFSGVVKDIGNGSPSLYKFNDVPNATYRELAVKVKDGFSLERAKEQIDTVCLKNKVEVRGMSDGNTRRIALENHLEPTMKIITATSIFTIIIGLIGMLIAIRLSLQERIRETGIMKALGGTANAIATLVLIEYGSVSVISLAFGVVLSSVLTSVWGNILGTLILGSPIVALTNVPYLLVSIVLLLLILALTIWQYSYSKVKQSSNVLLNQVF
ncbi:MAG: ABC transporter permease [Spirosomataceae bacterium]